MSAYLHSLVQLAGLCFPAAGVWLAQRKGARALLLLWLGYVAAVVVWGFALASPDFGNGLAATEGYWKTARSVLGLLITTMAVPASLSSLAIARTATWATTSRMALAYAVFLVATLLGWLVLFWWHFVLQAAP